MKLINRTISISVQQCLLNAYLASFARSMSLKTVCLILDISGSPKVNDGCHMNPLRVFIYD